MNIKINLSTLSLLFISFQALSQNNIYYPASGGSNENKHTFITPNSNNNNNTNQYNTNPAYPNIILNAPTVLNNANNGSTGFSKKPIPSKPDNPGYDTTSSLGGPSNNQGSVTYGSDGTIKTVKPLNSNK
jgi:hypothetical protein